MPELKGSQTHQNLKDAFAGESQANRRYLYYAKQADVEGYPEIYGSSQEGQDQELSAQSNFSSRWGWFSSIYKLSGGDILKFDSITSQPLFKCLNLLVFEKEKNELEQAMIKKSYKGK